MYRLTLEHEGEPAFRDFIESGADEAVVIGGAEDVDIQLPREQFPRILRKHIKVTPHADRAAWTDNERRETVDLSLGRHTVEIGPYEFVVTLSRQT